MIDPAALRKDFPIFTRHPELVYVDNAATTQRPSAVIDATTRFLREQNANVHRGIYDLSEEATEAYEGARAALQRFLGAAEPAEIVFTRNATEAINLVAATWGRQHIQKGDEIVVSILEHHSNLVPWQELARERGARVRFLDVDDHGELLVDQLDSLLTPKTKLLALTHMSNALGTIVPVAQAVQKAKAKGITVLLDGAQAAAHLPVNVQEIGCDFYVVSGHKFLAPPGIGALYARRAVLATMPPYQFGGDMILEVTQEKATWNDLPWRFEAGTPNIVGAIGLGAAIQYLEKIGMDAVRAHEKEITAYALEKFRGRQGLRLFGTDNLEHRGGIVPFTLAYAHPHDIASVFNEHHVAIRAGHHCAQPLLRRLGVPATARASFALYTTKGDIDRLVEALDAVEKVFG